MAFVRRVSRAATPSTVRPPGVRTRYAILLAGLWLAVSAFSWPHTPVSRANTAITGALVCLSGILSLRVPALRWAVLIFAGWLVLSTLLLACPGALETVLNNVIIAAWAGVLALIPGGPVRTE